MKLSAFLSIGEKKETLTSHCSFSSIYFVDKKIIIQGSNDYLGHVIRYSALIQVTNKQRFLIYYVIKIYFN